MNPQTLRLIVDLTIDETMVAFFAALGFILLYTIVAPWWKSALGWSIVALDGSIALTLLPSVIHHWAGVSTADAPVFAWFTVGAFALVPMVIAWRAWILVRLQIRHRQDVPSNRPTSLPGPSGASAHPEDPVPVSPKPPGAIARFNMSFARRATIIFGTMWAFYAFVIYGALGAIFPKYQAVLLYWSNWCQLWSLPLLMVGAYVLGQAAEKRDRETHDAVMEELAFVKESHAKQGDLIQEMHAFFVGPAKQVVPAPPADAP